MLPFILRYNDKGHAANANTADTEVSKCIRIDSDTKYAITSFPQDRFIIHTSH